MKKALVAILGILLFTAPAHAVIVFDFEDIPETYWYEGGGQNMGSYYPEVTFGPKATILEDQIYGYNSIGYPPHSGHAVLTSEEYTLRIDFANPTNHVGFWFSTAGGFYLRSYDSNDVMINEQVTNTTINYNDYISVNFETDAIAYVNIVGAFNTTIDDFEYGAVPIPGAVWLLGSGLVGIVGIRRKFKK